MADRVRTHTRRTASGKTATVRQHGRKGRPSKGRAFGYRGGWRLLRKAVAANRKKKRTAAIVLGGLGAGWLVARLTLDGAGFALVTAGVLATSVGYLLGSFGGVRR